MGVAQHYIVFTLFTHFTLLQYGFIALLASEQKAGRTGVEWTGH